MKQRNTIQRSLVLEAAYHLDHPTADQIYATISSTHPTISRGTVYRNLCQLAGNGLLRKVSIPGGADCFDKTLADHYHIRCKECGMVADVELDYQSNLLENVADAKGFEIHGHSIMLSGVCPHCQAADTTA